MALVGAAIVYLGSSMYPTEKIVDSRNFQKYPGILFEYEVTRYPVVASVTDITENHTGVPNIVNFGLVANSEDYVSKYISLENMGPDPAKMSMIARGEVGGFITFSRNNFVLQPGERTSVEMHLRPRGMPHGTHTGDIEVVVKRAKHPFLMSIW